MAVTGNGPMGGGIDTDISTGMPVIPQAPRDRAAEAKAHMEEAVLRAISLQSDLARSPVLALMLQQFTNRLDVLSKSDPVCATILAVLVNIRNTIDIVPEHAHKRFKDILGGSVVVPPAVIPDTAADAIPEPEQV